MTDVFSGSTVAAEVVDGGAIAIGDTWDVGMCARARRGGKVTCTSIDRLTSLTIKRVGKTNRWKFRLKLRRQPVPGNPVSPGVVHLHYGDVDWIGTPPRCVARGKWLRCR